MSKYFIEKHHRVWFIFGETPTHVDISDGNDVLVKVPRAEAQAIIDAHNTTVSLVEALVQKHPECIPFGL